MLYGTSFPTGASAEGEEFLRTPDMRRFRRLEGDGVVAIGTSPVAIGGDVLDGYAWAAARRVVCAEGARLIALNPGAVLLTLRDVFARGSDGDAVLVQLSAQLLLSCPLGKVSAAVWSRIERSPGGADAWTAVDSLLLGSFVTPRYLFDATTLAATEGGSVRVAAHHQCIDDPPGDGTWDYRVIVSRTADGQGAAPPEAGAGVVEKARAVAQSLAGANLSD